MIERFFTPGHKIQRCTFGKGAQGGITETWVNHLTLSGKLWQLSGDKRLTQDKLTVYADHKFACSAADINITDRYMDPGGNTYHIKAVATRERPDGSGHMELSLERIE